MAQDGRRKFYDYLKSEGLYDGDFAEYTKNIDTKEGRRKLYDYMSGEGLYDGSWEEFRDNLTKQAPAREKVTDSNWRSIAQRGGFGGLGAFNAPKGDFSGKALMENNANPIMSQPKVTKAPTVDAYAPTNKHEKEIEQVANDALEGKNTELPSENPDYVADAEDRAYTAVQSALGNDVNNDFETYQYEDGTTETRYVGHAGQLSHDVHAYNERVAQNTAIAKAKRLDEARKELAKLEEENIKLGEVQNGDTNGYVDYESGAVMRQREGERNARLNANNERINALRSEITELTRYDRERLQKNINDLRSAVGEKIDAYARERQSRANQMANGHNGGYAQIGSAMSANLEMSANYSDNHYYHNADYHLREAQKLIDAAEANASNQQGFLSGAFGGFVDTVMNERNWDMGLTDMIEYFMRKGVVDKYEKSQGTGGGTAKALAKVKDGETLSDAENMYLRSVLIHSAAEQLSEESLSRGYKAGRTTGQALPFMIEMYLNPLSGGANTSASTIGRYASIFTKGEKAFNIGKKIVGLTYKGKGVLGKAVGNATRYAIGEADKIIRSTGMALTSGLPKVVGGVVKDMTGDIRSEYDENGNIQYAGTENEYGFWEALGKNIYEVAKENATEMGVGPVGAVARGVNYMMPNVLGGLNRVASKVGLYRTIRENMKVFTPTTFNHNLNHFLERTQWHGTLGEYWEEVEGNVLDGIVSQLTNGRVGGEMNFNLDINDENSIFNLDNNIDTFLGVALMGGFTSAISTLGYRNASAEAEKRLASAEERAKRIFPSTWSRIKEGLDALDPDAKDESGVSMTTRYIIGVMGRDVMTEEQKKAVFDYIHAREFANGVAMGGHAENVEADKDIIATVNEEASTGDADTSAEGLRKTGITSEMASQSILSIPNGEQIKMTIDRVLEDGSSNGEISSILEGLGDAEKKIVSDYIDSYTERKKIESNIEEQVQQKVEEHRPIAEKLADKYGAVDLVETTDGEIVSILGMSGDNFAIARMDGTPDMVDKKSIKTADNGKPNIVASYNSIEEYLEAFGNDVRAELTEKYTNAQNHNENVILEPKVGDVVMGLNGEQPAEFKVMGQTQDGKFNVVRLVNENVDGIMQSVPSTKDEDMQILSATAIVSLQDMYYDSAIYEELTADSPSESGKSVEKTEEKVAESGEETAEKVESSVESGENSVENGENSAGSENPKVNNIAEDEEGEPVFDDASDSEIADYFADNFESDEANVFLQGAIDSKRKALDKVAEKKPNGADAPKASDYVGRPNAYKRAKEEWTAKNNEALASWEEEQRNAQADLDKWVSARNRWQKAQTDMATDAMADEAFSRDSATNNEKDEALGEAQSLEEFVMREAYKYRYQWSDTDKGKGLSSEVFGKDDAGERGKRLAYLSNKEGFTPRKVSELITQSAKESGLFGQDINDDDVFNMLVDTLLSHENRGKVLEHVKEIRDRQNEKPEGMEINETAVPSGNAEETVVEDDGSALEEEVRGGRIADSDVTAEIMDEESVGEAPAEEPKSAVEAPKSETPKAKAPKARAPKAETPKTEAPKGVDSEEKGVNRKLKGLSDEENERLVELKKQMAELIKGKGKLYSSIVPIDPDAPQKIAVGTQIAFLYVKSGIVQFRDFCDNLIGDLGDEIRPYLKSIYNAVRDYPNSDAFADDMTPYDEVRKFDVLEYDKEPSEKMDIVEKAEEVVAEENQLKEQDAVAEVVVRQGKPRKKDKKGNDGFFGDLFASGNAEGAVAEKSGKKGQKGQQKNAGKGGKKNAKDSKDKFEAEKKEPISLEEARRLYYDKESIDKYDSEEEDIDTNNYQDFYKHIETIVDKIFADWNIEQYYDEEYEDPHSYDPKNKYYELSNRLLESSAWGRGHAACVCIDALSGDLSRAKSWIAQMLSHKFSSYTNRIYDVEEIEKTPQHIANIESTRNFLYEVFPNMKELIDNVIALDIDTAEQRVKHLLNGIDKANAKLEAEGKQINRGAAPISRRVYQSEEESEQTFAEWIFTTSTTDKINIDKKSNNGWHTVLVINGERNPLYAHAEIRKTLDGKTFVVGMLPKWTLFSKKGYASEEARINTKNFFITNPDVEASIGEEYIEFANASDMVQFFEEVFPNKTVPTDLENYSSSQDEINDDVVRAMIANGVKEVKVGKARYTNPTYNRFFDYWEVGYDTNMGGGGYRLTRKEGYGPNSLLFDEEEQTKERKFEFPKGTKDANGKEIGTKKVEKAKSAEKKAKKDAQPKKAENGGDKKDFDLWKNLNVTLSAEMQELYDNEFDFWLKGMGSVGKLTSVGTENAMKGIAVRYASAVNNEFNSEDDVKVKAHHDAIIARKEELDDKWARGYFDTIEDRIALNYDIPFVEEDSNFDRKVSFDTFEEGYYQGYQQVMFVKDKYTDKMLRDNIRSEKESLDDVSNDAGIGAIMGSLQAYKELLGEDSSETPKQKAKYAVGDKVMHKGHEFTIEEVNGDGTYTITGEIIPYMPVTYHNAKEEDFSPIGKSEAPKAEKNWRYSVNIGEGGATIHREEVMDNGYAIGDGRWEIHGKDADELLEIIHNNGMDAILDMPTANFKALRSEIKYKADRYKEKKAKKAESAPKEEEVTTNVKKNELFTSKKHRNMLFIAKVIDEESGLIQAENENDYMDVKPYYIKFEDVDTVVGRIENGRRINYGQPHKYHGGDMVRLKDGVMHQIVSLQPKEGGWNYEVQDIKDNKKWVDESEIDEVVESYASRKEGVGTPEEAQPRMVENGGGENGGENGENGGSEEKPSTKDGWLRKIHEVYQQLCEKYGVPVEPLFEDAYRFGYKITKGYTLDKFEPYYESYKKKLDDAVEPATEKQWAFIKKLADDSEWSIIEGANLNKISASYVIAILKASEDAITSRSGSAQEFEEYAKELEKVAELNGKKVLKSEEKSVTSQRDEASVRFSQTIASDMLNALETGERPYNSIVELRKKARECGMDVADSGENDILLQELVEDGLVSASRKLAENRKEGIWSKEFFEKVCKLYDMQPNISARSSNRIMMQQYSTPLPMGYVADMFAVLHGNTKSVLEPTAGNGMLVSFVPANRVHANELDGDRLANLREQGFKQVTNQDATLPFEGGKQYDGVIMNPPFGYADAKEYDGKMISGLDPQIVINALESMKDDGRASIIIGGNLEYARNGSIKGKKAFFSYLYDHYNVKGIINIDGDMYKRQGTTYPTMMIFIDGRRSNEERAKSVCYPPVQSNARGSVSTFGELYDKVKEILNDERSTDGTELVRSQELALDFESEEREGNGKSDSGQHRADDADGRGQNVHATSSDSTNGVRGESGQAESNGRTGRGTQTNGNASRSGRGDKLEPVPDVGTSRRGVGLEPTKKIDTPKESIIEAKVEKLNDGDRQLDQEKMPYKRHNTAFSLNSVAPASMVEAMDKNLTEIEKEYGSIDEFVTTELGYDSVEDAHKALAAEQMDSVAMAIAQMKKGKALIIGDQTGVGKGRQMAALIRWAVKQGKKPVFVTQKATLFSDIYRDLVDIGSGELRPFIFNSDGAMTDNNGKTVFAPMSAQAQAKVYASGKLPDDCDYAIITYSQVNTGDAIAMQEAESAKKELDANERGRGKKQSKAVKDGKPTPKATFLREIVKDNYVFLDESHSAAGGDSNIGLYFQSILKTVKACTFASATFAKRPDTMSLYALKTAMSEANISAHELIKVIIKGGVTLQEIMARALSTAGQMVRRERDMRNVVTDWKTIDDPKIVETARTNYDKTIDAFNAIIDFQKTYVDPQIDALNAALSIKLSTAEKKKGTDKMGVSNEPFANRTYLYTKQLMLALKAQAIAEEVDKEIKAGRHPVIALESTMESSIKDYKDGEVIEDATFSASLLRGLDSTLKYTEKDADGKEIHHMYRPEMLGEEGERAYYELREKIIEQTKDIYISPLDAIIDKLHEMRYSVGELTGRKLNVVKEGGKAVVRKRTNRDKKALMRMFNSGELDVLILNKSASTGISLHASEKFSDQRQRTMIIAEPLSDINDYMQMIGRIDRTGQVHRGYYINLGLPVPAENRFLMMLSTKLKSLNANTTTSQDSESNDVEAPDLLNKYGGRVVIEYLRDHVDVYDKMGNPLKFKLEDGSYLSQLEKYKWDDETARKITGYVALLSTKEQEEFYDDVIQRYTNLINYLNDTGENDLKITVMPLRAKTVAKKVSSKGKDSNGDNPFAKDAFVEKVEMDVLRKPMKAKEVQSTIESLNGGKMDNGTIRELQQKVKEDAQERRKAEDERYNKALAKFNETFKKVEEKIRANKKIEESEKAGIIASQRSEMLEALETKHVANLKNISANEGMFTKYIGYFGVGETYLMPETLDNAAFNSSSPAIFCGIKAKEKMTPSTTFAVFAILDGRRRIELPLSQTAPLMVIKQHSLENYDAVRRTTLANWDENIPNNARKNGYIMTGNIIQAVADTQDKETGAYVGQLISYTDIDGNIHDGILMPDTWNPSNMRNAGLPISSALKDIRDGLIIRSIDEKVAIRRSTRNFYELSVPSSQKQGGKYYKSKMVLDLVENGNFYQRNGEFKALVSEENLADLLKVLDGMGVRIEDDSADAVRFRRSTEKEDVSREMDRMEEAVTAMAEALHIPVKVVRTHEEVDALSGVSRGNKETLKREGKGMYNTASGEVVIFLPNNEDARDAVKTVLHEIVGHKGLRNLVGEESYNRFLAKVYASLPKNVRSEINKRASEEFGWDVYEATDEMLAEMAEKNETPSWWEKVVSAIRQMLREAGMNLRLNDNDVKYLLWQSKNRLMKGDIVSEAESRVMRAKLGIGTQRRSAKNGGGESVRFRTSEELDREYPNWNDTQTTSKGGHSTQISGTTRTYQKIGQWILDNGMEDAKILDASSGKGLGTKAMREMGLNVDDVEPYAPNDREAPTFTSYDDITDKYDIIISNAVLNVIPDDWRRGVLMQMAEHLADGGKMIINTRGISEAKGVKNKVELDDASEILISNGKGGYRSYQKFFNHETLTKFIKDTLGDGYEVEKATVANSGIANEQAVVVTKMATDPNGGGRNTTSKKGGLRKRLNDAFGDSEDLAKQISSAFQYKNLARKFSSIYNSKPIVVLDKNTTSDQLRNQGFGDEAIEDIEKGLKSKDYAGYYDTDSDKIVIFADRLHKIRDIISTLIHENVHAIINDGLVSQDVIDSFAKEAISKQNELYEELKNAVDENGEPVYVEDLNEEFFVCLVEYALVNGREELVTRHLDDEGIKAFNNILKALNYEQGTRRGNGLLQEEGNTLSDNGVQDKKAKGGRHKIVTTFADGTNIVEKDKVVASAMYEHSLKQGSYKFQEAWQDSMLGLKKLMEAVVGAEKKKYEDIADWENPYMAENLMSSVNQAEFEAYSQLLYKPMLDTIDKVLKLGVDYEDVKQYLVSKHGLERNEVFARRDAERVAKEAINYDRQRKGIERQYISGDIDEDAYTDMISELEAELAETMAPYYEENREKDYSGLTALYAEGDETVAELEEKAKEFVDAFEDRVGSRLVDKLWDRINACNEATLEKQLQSGLMNQVNHDLVRDMFEYYVPLRGFDETTSDEVYDYLQHSQSPMNEPIKSASGRRSLADDPIATIGNMAESGIMAGNRNLMKQKLLNFVENHRSNILGVSDVYLKKVDSPTGEEWVAIAPEYKANMSAEEMERVRMDFVSWFEDMRRDNPDDYRYGRDVQNIPYKTLKKFEAEHLVFVKRGGKPYMITVQGNPRAAQAVNGLTNPHGTKNKIIQGFESVNRFLASMFTNRNPAFVIANLCRDAIYANSLVGVKEDRRYARRFHANWVKAVGSTFKLVRKYKDGTLDMSDYMEKAFYDFIMNGGETGFTSLNSVDEYRDMITSELKLRESSTLSPKKALAFVDKALDTFNRWAEDTSRFAAYLTSKEMGRSTARSIYDAKEITVNFNKKGAGASVVSDENWLNPTLSQGARELYIFFNAGVQGIANVMKAMNKSPKKFAIMGASYFGMGVIMPWIGMLLSQAVGGDDDDYWNIPEYVRRNNLCICCGGFTIKIPLPIELRMFYGLGELAFGHVGGYTNYRGADLARRVAEQMSQVAPIDMLEGGGGIGAFVPSYVKPVFEIYTNKDWTGIPIEKQNEYNKDMPNWTKAYKGTSPMLVGLAEAMNEFSGGDDVTKGAIDIDPAWVEHLWQGYFGGLGTTASQTAKLMEMPFNEDVREMRNVPVINRFIATGDNRAEQKRINNEYFSNKEYMDEFGRRLGQYKKIFETTLDVVKRAEYQRKYADMLSSEDYTKYVKWKTYSKKVNDLNEKNKEIGGDDEIENNIFTIKKEANKEMRK